MTTKLKQQFVNAMDNGNYGLAQDILGQLFDFYKANGGYDTVTEAIEFETVVKWFDAVVVPAIKEPVLA
jgi:hypothetical protein